MCLPDIIVTRPVTAPNYIHDHKNYATCTQRFVASQILGGEGRRKYELLYVVQHPLFDRLIMRYGLDSSD